jgi:tetratricopeptide (TPR) repeat protein
MKYLLHLSLLCIFSAFLSSQVEAQPLDSIRQAAWDGSYKDAREMCMDRPDYPDNIDLLFLVGQTYQWEGNLSSAKDIFIDVLNRDQSHLDALSALTTINISENKYNEAIKNASEGLYINNEKEDLLYNRAFAFVQINKMKEARKELQNLLSINPNHEDAQELKASMEYFKIPGAIGIYQSIQWHNAPYKRRHYTSTVEAPIGDKKVKIIPRFNYSVLQADDNESNGSQAGLDVYPLTGPGSYLYIHYAYSESEVFPSHRSALEWFTTLHGGWGVSIGARHLFWTDHQYFVSISGCKYIGKWLPGVRLYYTPGPDNNLTVSTSLRRFLSNADNYIHMYLNYGANPDRMDKQLDFFDKPSKSTRYTGGAYTIFKIGGSFYARLLAEYNFEEYKSDTWRDTFLTQIGIELKF